MRRKLSAFAIAVTSLTLASCGSTPTEPSPDLTELTRRTSLSRSYLHESLERIHEEGCRWGYGNITDTSSAACFSLVTKIPTQASTLSSGMDLMSRLDIEGADGELARETARIAKTLAGFEGNSEEKGDFDAAWTDSISVLSSWPDSSRAE